MEDTCINHTDSTNIHVIFQTLVLKHVKLNGVCRYRDIAIALRLICTSFVWMLQPRCRGPPRYLSCTTPTEKTKLFNLSQTISKIASWIYMRSRVFSTPCGYPFLPLDLPIKAFSLCSVKQGCVSNMKKRDWRRCQCHNEHSGLVA